MLQTIIYPKRCHQRCVGGKPCSPSLTRLMPFYKRCFFSPKSCVKTLIWTELSGVEIKWILRWPRPKRIAKSLLATAWGTAKFRSIKEAARSSESANLYAKSTLKPPLASGNLIMILFNNRTSDFVCISHQRTHHLNKRNVGRIVQIASSWSEGVYCCVTCTRAVMTF